MSDVLTQLDRIERRLSALETAAEISATTDQQMCNALERILALISAEPVESENDLAETLRQLVAATQQNGQIMVELVRSIRNLPREISDQLARADAL